ncbi:MAG: hypothetical protein JHC39_03725 [Lentimicrobium sp.]|jgi:hypothetical protein|nr:hypothetical protein [Lentimicrobium sp.]
MKLSKTIFKILIVFLFLAQNSFATTPIPGVGIVVKKNPGGGSITVPTGNGGSFSTQLEEGEYELSFPQDQLQSVVSKLIKRNYPKSTYQYDGSGVELVLDNPQIRIKLKPTKENIYTINEQNSSFIIIVPAGGATLSGILSWNDNVMTNSISCPDGFMMQNGECVPIRNTENQQERTEGKLKGKIVKGGDNGMISVSAENSENPTARKGWDGSIKGKNIAEKGITENGLKKNEIENVANDAEVKAIAETMVNRKSVNNINGGMPNRISMNVTVPKQTQGATFGEKVNSGKINVTLVEGGCVILFPSNEGYRVNTSDKSINDLSRSECQAFGEKVNQGLHAAGGALSQGASLLGGALPGGAVISAAVSSVGNLAGGAGGGAAAASYARTGKTVQKIQDNESDATLELQDGEYELAFVIVEKATSDLKDTLKTQVRIGFTVENGVVKPKQYTGHVTLMK